MSVRTNYMAIEDKIIENVKEQALIHTRMSKMQNEFEELKLAIERKAGKMEALLVALAC